MSLSTDPVANGFAASLPRPGGNITGLSMMLPALSGKRLELLREINPKIARVAFLAHGGDPAHKNFIAEMETAGKALGIRIEPRHRDQCRPARRRVCRDEKGAY